MSYRIHTDNTLIREADGAFVPRSPGNRDYEEFLAWEAEGNTPAPASPPPAPAPDWRGLLVELREGSVFSALRNQARTDLASNGLASEMRTLLGEAALGMADVPAIQALLDELVPSLDEAERAEVAAAIAGHNVPLTLPPAP